MRANNQNNHLVTTSPWPLFTSFSLFSMAIFAVSYFFIIILLAFPQAHAYLYIQELESSLDAIKYENLNIASDLYSLDEEGTNNSNIENNNSTISPNHNTHLTLSAVNSIDNPLETHIDTNTDIQEESSLVVNQYTTGISVTDIPSHLRNAVLDIIAASRDGIIPVAEYINAITQSTQVKLQDVLPLLGEENTLRLLSRQHNDNLFNISTQLASEIISRFSGSSPEADSIIAQYLDLLELDDTDEEND